jgi:hypothetical protein
MPAANFGFFDSALSVFAESGYPDTVLKAKKTGFHFTFQD